MCLSTHVTQVSVSLFIPDQPYQFQTNEGLIILNSAHLRWCVCQMTVRRVRTLWCVCQGQFLVTQISDSYLWCSRHQRKACFQRHIRSHASSPAERKPRWEKWLEEEEEHVNDKQMNVHEQLCGTGHSCKTPWAVKGASWDKEKVWQLGSWQTEESRWQHDTWGLVQWTNISKRPDNKCQTSVTLGC